MVDGNQQHTHSHRRAAQQHPTLTHSLTSTKTSLRGRIQTLDFCYHATYGLAQTVRPLARLGYAGLG